MCLCDMLATNGSAAGAPVAPSPRLVWHMEDEGRGTPAIAGRTAFFLSKRHELVAVQASSGHVLWRARTPGTGDQTAGSRVITSDARVIVGDDAVVGFDGDGQERWRFDDPTMSAAGIYLGDAARGLVFAGSASGRIAALDATSGRLRWAASVGGEDTTVFAPVADEQLVVAGYTTFAATLSGGVVAWDARTGQERWRVPFANAGSPAGLTGGPVLADRYVAATSRDGIILVIERRSGRVLTTVPAVGVAPIAGLDAVSQDFRALAWADRGRVLIAGSLTGVVVSVDAATGVERWRRRPVAASVGFALTLEDGTLYVPYLSGPLVALDASSGTERWRTPAEPGFSWAPAAFADRVYAAGSRKGFFAFIR
jgi:outer membrane protein assembly factor BamB